MMQQSVPDETSSIASGTDSTELIRYNSMHYINAIKGRVLVKVLNVEPHGKPTFKKLDALLRSAHPCNQVLGFNFQQDRFMGFSERNSTFSSSSFGINGIDGDDSDCKVNNNDGGDNDDDDDECKDGCDDLSFTSMTLKELQNKCKARLWKNPRSKKHKKPEAAACLSFESLSRKRSCAFLQPMEEECGIEETLSSWKLKLSKKSKAKKRPKALDRTCSSSKSEAPHVQANETSISFANRDQDFLIGSLNNNRDLLGVYNIKCEGLESDLRDLHTTNFLADRSMSNKHTSMDLSGESPAELFVEDDASNLQSGEPIVVTKESLDCLVNSASNEFQQVADSGLHLGCGAEVSAGIKKMGSSEITSDEVAHSNGSSENYSSQHGISSEIGYNAGSQMPDRAVDYSIQSTDIITNCNERLIYPAITDNPSSCYISHNYYKCTVAYPECSLDACEKISVGKDDGENGETGLDKVHIHQIPEGSARFTREMDITELGNSNGEALLKGQTMTDISKGHLSSDSNEDQSTRGSGSVGKGDETELPMVYFDRVPEGNAGLVPGMKVKMVERINNEELHGGEVPGENSHWGIAAAIFEGQSTSGMDTIFSPLQNSHPPTKLLSTRKTISPASQEKLRLAVNGEELHDNTQVPKHRKRICFEKWTKNKNSSAGAGLEEAEAMVPEAISKKLKNIQNGSPPLVTKGILKSSSSTNSVTCCACNDCSSIRKSARKALEFSQRQMQDIESLASRLMKELKSMKTVIAENLMSEASPKYTTDEMLRATESATDLEETTRRWLSMMARDCNRFCKIMRLTEKKVATCDGFHKERKKISFADEAGGMLCNVKVFEDQSCL